VSLRRVLVANRGEIALRIIRACRELGIESVAVCSTADAAAPYARAADQRVTIGGPHPRDSYLDTDRLIDAARRTDADAVHPGYGFLSESAAFADAVVDAGLVWIGPPAEVIARLGSKIEARRLMAEAGVPIVPGETPADQSDAGLRTAATRLGVPLLVKASAGGGGRGMRVVREPGELADAIELARREATAAFGDGTLYVERLFEHARHVEVQIMADHHDRVVHLFERECSLQRRHQKVVEESPAPHLHPAVRERVTTAAVTAARATGYRNAGTVEFLVDGGGDTAGATVAFLEMNTRLQVEHPLTEAVTGRDLVHAQLRIAAGAPLPWRQDEIGVRGHAIECRVYAEDPDRGFLPDAGPLLRYEEPHGPGLRVDAGVEAGGVVPSQYDALLAKLIAWADDRPTALARARTALGRYTVLGVRNNIGFLRRLLAHPRVVEGRVDTRFLEAALPELVGDDEQEALALAAALAVDDRLGGRAGGATPLAAGTAGAVDDPWRRLGGWRLS